MKSNRLVGFLVATGSVSSIGFGVWHFFVPGTWGWYSYIDVNATELAIAIRAINTLFSLALVLSGVVNMLLVHGNKANRYSIVVVLAATCILWVTRLVLQLVDPQGSTNPVLQYGMLSAFIVVSLCYTAALMITALRDAAA